MFSATSEDDDLNGHDSGFSTLSSQHNEGNRKDEVKVKKVRKVRRGTQNKKRLVANDPAQTL